MSMQKNSRVLTYNQAKEDRCWCTIGQHRDSLSPEEVWWPWRLCQHIIDMVTLQYAHTRPKKRIGSPVCSDVRDFSRKCRKPKLCCRTAPLEWSSHMSVGLICPWHFLLENENVFNCSRHQRLVTVAFRCCVKIFLLTFFRCINSNYHQWWDKKKKSEVQQTAITYWNDNCYPPEYY